MRNIGKYVLGFALVLLVMLTAMASLPNIKNRWLRLSGAVIPNGSRTESYTDKPIRILSAEGQRWLTGDRLQDASAYHALVILPSVPISNIGDSSGNDGYHHRLVEKWLMRGNEEKGIEIDYDAMRQTITVDSRTYSLRNGNLFVIRFGENWKPEVTQLSKIINERSIKVEELKTLMDAFKSALPEDEMIQQL
jgi:hypothetical protein